MLVTVDSDTTRSDDAAATSDDAAAANDDDAAATTNDDAAATADFGSACISIRSVLSIFRFYQLLLQLLYFLRS